MESRRVTDRLVGCGRGNEGLPRDVTTMRCVTYLTGLTRLRVLGVLTGLLDCWDDMPDAGLQVLTALALGVYPGIYGGLRETVKPEAWYDDLSYRVGVRWTRGGTRISGLAKKNIVERVW